MNGISEDEKPGCGSVIMLLIGLALIIYVLSVIL